MAQIRKEKDEEMKKSYGKWSKESHHLEGEGIPRWVVRSRHLRCTTLKIRPKNNLGDKSSLITQAKFLFLIQIQVCVIHEARHCIYSRECLGEQDRRVGVSFVRNLLEGR